MGLIHIAIYTDITREIRDTLNWNDEAFIPQATIVDDSKAKLIAKDLLLHCKYDTVNHIYIFSKGKFNPAKEHIIC